MRTSIPDYYVTLEIDATADAEIIKAAYYRLMRKYHPDALSTEQRTDPIFIKKAQDINEAYDVLSDSEKKAQYDNQRKLAAMFVKEGFGGGSEFIEKRRYAVRCSTTGKSFHLIVARPVEDTGKYKVVGFSPLETLADPQANDPMAKLVTAFWRLIKGETEYIPSGVALPLRMGEVNWSGSRCPACEKAYQPKDAKGTRLYTYWVKCGRCQRLFCASTMQDTRFGTYVTCAWCHSRLRFKGNVPPNAKGSPIGGLVHKTEETNPYYQGHDLLPPPDK